MASTDILLVACYELGHQPLSLAWPAAVLRGSGYTVSTTDLAVESLSEHSVRAARMIAISVPMHTAMRLGVPAARQIRELNPQAPIIFYGLYAWLNADYLTKEGLADYVLAGELESELESLAHRLLNTEVPQPSKQQTIESLGGPLMQRLQLPVPDRSSLPSAERYARFMVDGTATLAGYVEATRGCLHTCRHCPVVPVYNGRFFIVRAETVLADIRQQVAQDVRHITFGDPDFLNGPGHVMAIARKMHAEFPHLTFDFTTKVEHIIQHRDLIHELRRLGAAFVVSAFESVDPQILTHLHKGHTPDDMVEALDILAAADLPVQPTWLPFTPWTTLNGYLDLLAWIRVHNLIANVPAVQLSIRLLVPPRSALLAEPDTADWLGELDAANFNYRWQNPDPCVEQLHQHVSRIAEKAGDDPFETFAIIEQLAYGLAGRVLPQWQPPAELKPQPPRLTEDWFC